MADPDRAPLGGADLALCVFLVPLTQGRRVLWLGPLAVPLHTRLCEGAKEVRVADSLEALSGPLRSSAEGAAPVSFRPHWCDVAVVSDVSCLGSDPEESLALLANVLAEEGVLLLAAVAGAGLSYEALQHLARRHGEHVTMIGRSRFLAWSFAHLGGGGQGAVVVDGSSVPANDEEATCFYALASKSTIAVEERVIVRVPTIPEEARAAATLDRKDSAAQEHERLEGLLQDKTQEQRQTRRELAAAMALCRDVIEAGRGGTGGTRAADTETQRELRELAETVASRDRLVSRLQVDLAAIEYQRQEVNDLERQLRDENRRLREAVVTASARVEESDALSESIRSMEGEAQELRARLEEAEAIGTAHKQAISVLERERNAARRSEEACRSTLADLRERLTLLQSEAQEASSDATLPGPPSGLLEQ